MKNSERKRRALVCSILSLAVAASYTFASAGMVNADENKPVPSGDVNGDGIVSAADAAAMINYLMGKEETVSANADMNGDGRVNIADAILLTNKLLNPSAAPSVTPSETPSSDPSVKPSDTPSAAPSETPSDGEEKTITLNGDSAVTEGSGVKAEGSKITITEPGTYVIKGKLNDGQIIVDVDKTAYPEGKVELSLEGAEITSLTDSPVYVASCADECVITVKKGTDNVISDGTEYKNADEGVGAIYSKDDLKIKGKGNLTVNGNCKDGIVSKDSLKIFNGNITVNAVDDGIRGKDSVKIGDSDDEDYSNLSVTVNAPSGDGIKSTNDTDEGKGKVIINGGTVKVTAFGDGIQGESDVKIAGGDIEIYTYEGSGYAASGSTTGGNTGGWGRPGGFGGGMGMDGNANKMPDDLSAKGIKSSGTINITGGNITIDASDDAIHGAGDVNVTGGSLVLKSADDGVHSDTNLVIGAGTSTTYDDVFIYVPKCYEGIEAMTITQNSGTVVVYADDDGYNAAGGADGSGMGGPGGWNQGGGNWGGFGGFGDVAYAGSTSYALTLKGGLAYVSSADGDHDGFDSNGTITIDGAIAVSNGNEAFDCDGAKTFTSGTFVEISGGQSGFGFPGGSSVGWNESFAENITAQKDARITITDGSGNLIVSFLAGKPATKVSVGSKTASSGKITVSEDIPDGTALPSAGGCQQIYVGK